jgi:hypothetical protein
MSYIVHVSSLENNSVKHIEDGEEITVRELVAEFLGIESPAEFNDGDKNIRILNFGRVTDLDRVLKANETVMVYDAEVANGGVKGATS